MSDVTITRLAAQGMITLKGDLTAATLATAVADVTGLDMVAAREIRRGDDRGLAWMAPDELLLLLPHAEVPSALAAIDSAMGDTPHLAADVSDARAVFRISGDPRRILAKGTPADLRPSKFGPGEIRRTRLGQVAVAFWLTDEDAAELVCFTSVADFVADWLDNAAA
ncbi:MAG: sarcosine oxidase subunit gamma family protein [Pseudomonadota bacterium]